ncbi:MAG: hypothetical protein CL698_00560 [Chloroflexi bacterium]|nr:hypothetical protein [Chloroflexota bacterium]|tara:strand:+ start:2578 stop:3177 length:600 start_codon:yes stop_codon:yes gene_type:complete
MAREIIIEFDNQISKFSFSKISREKLYGWKKTSVVDRNSQPCILGSIPLQGDVIIPKGGISAHYVTDDYKIIPKNELEVFGNDGEKLERKPSTLGVPQKSKKVDSQALLDHRITSIYSLEPTEFDDATIKRLENGEIISAPFNYTASFNETSIFLLKTEKGIFGLVGETANLEYCSHEVSLDNEDYEETEEIELDFGML